MTYIFASLPNQCWYCNIYIYIYIYIYIFASLPNWCWYCNIYIYNLPHSPTSAVIVTYIFASLPIQCWYCNTYICLTPQPVLVLQYIYIYPHSPTSAGTVTYIFSSLSNQCWYCNKMLYSNVAAMLHIQGHIDSDKQVNLDLNDLTSCKHCYKTFNTPFEMQTHIEKVWVKSADQVG